MKANIIKKGILILVVVSLLAIGFTGCGGGGIITTTGTVTIVLTGEYEYHLYMDGYLQFEADDPVAEGSGSIYYVPEGYHIFEAVDTWGDDWGYDSVRQYIYAGMTNYVYLNP